MTNTTLKESSIGLGKVSGKKRWRARIIAVGRGSSGYYTEEALRDTGAIAFPVGSKINVDHQSWSESMDFPAGSLKNLAGVIVSTPEFQAEGEDIAGLYAEVEFSDEWAPFVEQFSEFIGLSINAQGYGEEYNEEGVRIVEGFVPSVLNTVDLVTAPGAKGRLIQALESYRETHGTLSTDANTDRKEVGMTPEQIAELKEALVSAVNSGFADLKESLKPEEQEPVVDAVTVSDTVDALSEADLPKAFRMKALEAVNGGTPLAEAIADQKALIESAREGLTLTEDANPGVVRGGTSAPKSYTVPGWSR